jgi:hypothetical protein
MATTPNFAVYGLSRTLTVARLLALSALLLAVIVALVLLLSSSGGAAKTASPPADVHAATHTAAHGATATHAATHKARATPAHKVRKPLPPPSHTPVMVLNSNGVSGAAGAMAARLRGYGYPTPVVTNAPSRGLPSAVEFRPGFGRAARALARRLGGIRPGWVVPLDGITVSDLHGADLVVIVGA